jgi:FemAB-related protein (PEP-CTERM system-associated)
LTARGAGGTIAGALPLIRQKSFVFGDRLTSLPFFNYGGALGDSEDIRKQLMERAAELGRELGVKQIEFRDVLRPPVDWPCRTDKVTMLLELPDSIDALGKQVGSKLRSQVKRAVREQPEVLIGASDRIPDFYSAFCEVMRDLGTPVYPRRFFEQLVSRMPAHCTLVTIRLGGQPAAGAFLVGHRGTMEIPWAATAQAAKPKSINMLLYWEVLRLAIERGYRLFDFGRSTVDSGPFRFKQQWGAQPVRLHWTHWRPNESTGRISAGTGPGRVMPRAIAAWRKLPVAVANRLGPLISPDLPW